MSSTRNTIICMLLLAFPCIVLSVVNCTSANQTLQKGCIVCDSSLQIRILNISENLYTCTDSLGCLLWNNSVCQTCQINYVKNDSNSNICTLSVGCLTMTSGKCTACRSNYYLDKTTDTCKQSGQTRCQVINIDGTCSKCARPQMNITNNCTVSATICPIYNYDLLKCQGCNSGQRLDSSGSFCYVPFANCLYYDLSGCLKCENNYYLVINPSTSAKSCSQIFPVKVFAQYYYLGKFLNICRQRNYYYDYATNLCVKTTSTIENCQTQSSSICNLCIDGYYNISTTSCLPCYLQISNCLICSANNCITCIDGYFTSRTDPKVCYSCQQMFGCPICQSSTVFSSSYIQQDEVQCLKCNYGENLFDGQCYKCPDGYGFNIIQRSCTICGIANCQKCQNVVIGSTSNENCLWCNNGYFFDKVTGACVNMNSLSATNLVLQNAYQILIKASPQTNQLIYNNQTKLMTKCGQQTDGYICRCSSQKLIATSYRYNSLCIAFVSSITLNFSSLFGSSDVTAKQFTMYSKQIRMASQFPNYALNIATPMASQPLSYEQFATLLQISQIRSIHSTSSSPYLSYLYKLTREVMINVFPTDRNTIIFGNGFHFKFSPNNSLLNSSFLNNAYSANPSNRLLIATPQISTQQEYIKASVNTSSWIMIFVRFDPQPKQNLTGKIYVFTGDDAQLDCNLTVRKNGYVGSVTQLSILVNGVAPDQNTSVSLSSGYLNFKMKTSVSASPKPYQIIYTPSSENTNSYSSTKIQNLFYNESFFYIIFFVIVYLITIPLFSIVDFCQNEMHKRKVVNQNQITESNEESKKYHEGESVENVLFINYKEFFPLYNIGSTARPRRIIKLCLFILNVQHSVTFLTLIYFNLPAGQPIVAVVLGLPAYLCTVVMGYIVGFVIVLIPGNFKYLVNLIVPGYWAIWVTLMPRFLSNQYKPFVYIFVCIFFFVDLFLDGCQTLLVYFAIYQTQKQTALFRCLARWLSYRGYYEYEKLAREIIDN